MRFLYSIFFSLFTLAVILMISVLALDAFFGLMDPDPVTVTNPSG